MSHKPTSQRMRQMWGNFKRERESVWVGVGGGGSGGGGAATRNHGAAALSTQGSFGGFAIQSVKWLDSILTFLVQALLLIQNDELAVLVRLLQDVLALLDVAVVVLQAQQWRNQGHVGLQPITVTSSTLQLESSSWTLALSPAASHCYSVVGWLDLIVV